MREKPVSIEVRKDGKYWAVSAEEQLIALTVYEKGAHMLEATLRGLLRYTSRKLFRQAVSDAMKGPKPVEAAKAPKAAKAAKAKPAAGTPKAEKAPAKKAPAKKERVTDPAPVKAVSDAAPVEASSSEPATVAPLETN